MEVEIDYLAIGKRIRTARLSKKNDSGNTFKYDRRCPYLCQQYRKRTYQIKLATLLGIAQSLDTTVDSAFI